MKCRMGKCVHMRQVLSKEIEYFVCGALYPLYYCGVWLK